MFFNPCSGGQIRIRTYNYKCDSHYDYNYNHNRQSCQRSEQLNWQCSNLASIWLQVAFCRIYLPKFRTRLVSFISNLILIIIFLVEGEVRLTCTSLICAWWMFLILSKIVFFLFNSTSFSHSFSYIQTESILKIIINFSNLILHCQIKCVFSEFPYRK